MTGAQRSLQRAAASGDRLPRRWRADAPFWFVALLVALVSLMLRTTYRTMDDITNGRAGTLPLRLFEETTGTAAAIPLVLIAVWAARRVPVPPATQGWPRTLGGHVVAFVVASASHTILIAWSRDLLAPLIGLDGYEYGALHLRLLMEAPNDVIIYAAVVTARLVTDSRRRQREREREALALERELAQSRLENLQLQLQPHFLFNALNTISSVMYENPRAADVMLGHLSDLLRQALGRAGSVEVPLGEELALLDSYLALARARFDDRLEVSVQVAPESRQAAVPPLLLQPLVENAIRHGVTPAGRGAVAVSIRTAGEHLMLAVENTVPAGVLAAGDASTGEAGKREHHGAGGHGIGLSATRRRLALLYGEEATLQAGPVEAGTYRVALALPLRRAGAPYA